MGPAGVFWLQLAPDTGAVRLWTLDQGGARPLSPPDYRIRSRINGYGGGALCLTTDGPWVVREDTGQVERLHPRSGEPVPVTGDRSDATSERSRYGGLVADPGRGVLAVRERLSVTGEVLDQALVAIATDGTETVLRAGAAEDCLGAPAPSDDGRWLAWVQWRLPAMPWHQSTLWLAQREASGALRSPRALLPPRPASVQQPSWSGHRLCVLSDHQGWWQPYRVRATGEGSQWSLLSGLRADHGNAPWQLAEQHHLGLPGGGWARVSYHRGEGQLWLASAPGARRRRLADGFTDFRCLQYHRGALYALASSDHRLQSLIRIDLVSDQLEVLAGGERPLTSVLRPQPFVLADAEVCGFFYPAVASGNHPGGSHRDPITPPPLILQVHGGPTSAAYPVLNLATQFWCQQGFSVLDLNHRGSSGAGRAFRQALAGRWGELEVADCLAAVAQLVREGRAHPQRLFVQGRSAGGYTALMAMASADCFRGAVSQFGVTDPRRLCAHTHRFESGYLDWLLGEDRDRWPERSPVNLAHRMTGPVLFFQGELDEVVVPAQTRAMAAAMARAGHDSEVVSFADEGHGFRHRASQAAVLRRSLAFYRNRMAAT